MHQSMRFILESYDIKPISELMDAYEELFRGTIDECMVHPREVLKVALAKNAAGVILAHNHLSGMAERSESDRRMTFGCETAWRWLEYQYWTTWWLAVRTWCPLRNV